MLYYIDPFYIPFTLIILSRYACTRHFYQCQSHFPRQNLIYTTYRMAFTIGRSFLHRVQQRRRRICLSTHRSRDIRLRGLIMYSHRDSVTCASSGRVTLRTSREHMAHLRYANTPHRSNHWHTAISHDRLGSPGAISTIASTYKMETWINIVFKVLARTVRDFTDDRLNIYRGSKNIAYLYALIMHYVPSRRYDLLRSAENLAINKTHRIESDLACIINSSKE